MGMTRHTSYNAAHMALSLLSHCDDAPCFELPIHHMGDTFITSVRVLLRIQSYMLGYISSTFYWKSSSKISKKTKNLSSFYNESFLICSDGRVDVSNEQEAEE